jgi:hypothetical protein
MTPFEDPRDNPEFRAPDTMLQVYGDSPPLVVNVVLYAVPFVPLGRNELLMLKLEWTVMLNTFVAV